MSQILPLETGSHVPNDLTTDSLALDAIFLAIACLILALLIFVGINHGAYITGAKAFILYAGIPASMFLGIIWSFRWPSVWRHRAFALALLLAAGAQAF